MKCKENKKIVGMGKKKPEVNRKSEKKSAEKNFRKNKIWVLKNKK